MNDDDAIQWVIRLRDGSAQDWAAFTEWLEQSPDHAAAYDRVAALDAGLDALPPAPAAPSGDLPAAARPAWSRRRVLGGGALAAAAAAAVALVLTGTPADDSLIILTRPGEMRSVQLADGSRVDMNGATRLVIDKDAPRMARLDRGEALFTVVHDDANPFRVLVGDDVVQDAGTVFNIVATSRRLTVAVAEGAVLFDPDRTSVPLSPGQALTKENGRTRVDPINPDDAGSWRERRLTYDGATVAQVAEDLARNLGVAVRADAATGQQQFSGVLMIDGEPSTVLSRAAAVMGLRARQSPDGWQLLAD